jgi:hypothetical protein
MSAAPYETIFRKQYGTVKILNIYITTARNILQQMANIKNAYLYNISAI